MILHDTAITVQPSPPYDFALTTEVARFYSVLGRRHGSAYYFGQSGKAARDVVDSLLARYHPFDGLAAYYPLTRWALEMYS